MFRAHKGSPNENAFRTLLPGCLLAVLILAGADPLLRSYDQHLRPQPWISVTMRIVQLERDEKPMILYSAAASSLVAGEWAAWVEPKLGDSFVRGCRGHGPGVYSPHTQDLRLWRWADWLGRDCAVPTGPFRVCVSYDIETPRGARRVEGPHCSEEWHS